MGKKRSARKAAVAQTTPAGLIFRGTVQRMHDSTVASVKPDGKTAIVRVDEVIAAPPALARLVGRDVTVVMGGGATMKPGNQAVFHASSLSFGQEVAVRAMSVDPIVSGAATGGMTAARAAAAPLAATHSAAPDPVQAHRDLQLKRSLDAADVVVTGTVTDVRMAPETRAIATSSARPVAAAVAGRRRARAGAAAVSGISAPSAPARISEHDGLWREAVVNVESVEKGTTPQQQVVVRFPGSNDVRWRNHPKFRTGQQGVFLLNATAVPGATARASGARFATAAGPSGQRASMQAMTEPQPMSAIEKVRELLTASAVSTRALRAGGRKRAARKASKRATRRTK